MQFIRLTILILLFTGLSACAGGSPSDKDPSPSEPRDAGGDATTRDAGDAGDAEEDLVDLQDDPCGACCPGDRTCAGEMTVGVCADDGSGYEEQACGDGQICEEGSCVDEPICEPQESVCNDATSRLICRASGTAWRTENCAADEACIDGECVAGAPNATECASDDECAGGNCRCGSDESCDPAPSRPYCTATCTPGSCGPDEICVSSVDFNGASYDHCLPACEQTCPHPGMTCASIPTRDSGQLAYVDACYFDHVDDVGDECSTAANCTGGICLHDYFDTGLCTFECAGDCPDGSACVELQSGTYHCSPLCGDGSIDGGGACPLEGGGDRWDVQCATRSTFGGGAKEVCVSTT